MAWVNFVEGSPAALRMSNINSPSERANLAGFQYSTNVTHYPAVLDLLIKTNKRIGCFSTRIGS
jgi:hypothetical protein